MQTVNDYGKDVFNGDVGRVLVVNPEEKRLSVDFEGNVVSYEAFELEESDPGVRDHDPQVAGERVSRRSRAGAEQPPHHVAAEPAVHGDYSRTASVGAGGRPEGDRGGGKERRSAATVYGSSDAIGAIRQSVQLERR